MARNRLKYRSDKLHEIIHTSDGFTLYEILVVMAIIGLLAHMAMLSYVDTMGKANDATAISDARNLVTLATDAFVDQEYPNFSHAPGDGPKVGLKGDGSFVFELSPGVKALVFGAPANLGHGYMEAYIYHAKGTNDPADPIGCGKRVFMCCVDEQAGENLIPSF
ncbi:MAG: type II secretion system protein [Thermodesulfobacteriota bacterium]|nr:type II secretion system protein [Thermodesulfobacteriota bacterium]